MNNQGMDKSLFFITLSAICVWLVVDVALGKNYLGGFLATLFPFMTDTSTPRGEMTTEEVEEAQKNAPSSSAMGGGAGRKTLSERVNGNYSTNGQIVGDSYRKN